LLRSDFIMCLESVASCQLQLTMARLQDSLLY